MVRYGILHCHSENSLHDSPMHVETLLRKAKILGAPAVALTDHDTMMGIDEFMELGKKYEINTIPGIEASYTMDIEQDPYLNIFGEHQDGLHRNHLILMAKDMDGYRALIKAVKMSNYHQEKNAVKTITYNLMDKQILRECFGPGSGGHGHVIATSACINGPITSILLYDFERDKKITRLLEKQSSLHLDVSEYTDLQKELNTIKGKIEENHAVKKYLSAIAKRSLRKKEQMLTRKEADFLKNSAYDESYELLKGISDAFEEIAVEREKERNEIELLKKDLERERAEQAQAKSKIRELEKEIQDLKERSSYIAAKIKEKKNIYEKYQKIEAQIQAQESIKKGEDILYQTAAACALSFVEIFGKANFYLELQYHGIAEEAYCMPILADIAEKYGIPVVAANDCHVPENTEECFRARDILRFDYFKAHNDRLPGDEELYIKNDEELSAVLSKILPYNIVEQAMENVGVIAASCKVKFEKKEHYPKYHGNALVDFLKYIEEGKEEKIKSGVLIWDERYQDRLEHEIPIIRDMGYIDYHLIIREIVRYARKIGGVPKRFVRDIPEDPERLEEWLNENHFEVGIGAGPGRGSAAGSLVCYLLGITNIDPIRYGLLFERFLNPERVSMPDIDSDIRTSLRPYVIRFIKWKFGKDAVCSILTKGKLQAKNAIRLAGRDLADELFGKNDSPEKKRVAQTANLLTKLLPSTPNITLENMMDTILTEIDTWEQKDLALTILDNARLIEGFYTSTGMHAGGVIISDNGDLNEYIPLSWNKEDKDPDRWQWTTQCDMVQAEQKGLLKIDILGLNTFDICSDCAQLVWKNRGIKIDFDTIPFEPEVFEHIYARGNTSSVFQFESTGMKNMLMDFQPENIEDIILLIAAYRPGPMQYLEKIIKVKKKQIPEDYLIPELRDILSNTYGSIIYQEQVQQIFQKLAGYSLGQADLVRRAMSKKKTEKLAIERTAFIHGDPERNIIGCKKNDIDPVKANRLFDEMMDFAKYAFNKSHAAAYAVVSYQTAYLKYHFPMEYLCSMFNNKEIDDYAPLFTDCTNYQIKILQPDINQSLDTFFLEDNAIRYGLRGIKGINNIDHIIEERSQNGIFTSIYDFFQRCLPDKKLSENLIKAGAFDSLYPNRTDLLKHYTNILDNPSVYTAAGKAYQKTNTDYLREKEVLGTFLTGNPLDNYESDVAYGCLPMDDSISKIKYGKVFGIINNLIFTKRKKDQSRMAIFTLSGKKGQVKVLCMDDVIRQQEELLQEGSVICIEGTIKADEELTVFAKKISELKRNKGIIVIAIDSASAWEQAKIKILPYTHDGEYELMVYLNDTGKFRKTIYTVSEDILRSRKLSAFRI